MTEVVMPRLSDSMEEGTILRWLVEDGAQVQRGDEIVEIETDKAAMTYEADADGVLEIVVAAGETLPVGATIARLGGGDGAAPVAESAAVAPAAAPAARAADGVVAPPAPPVAPPSVPAAAPASNGAAEPARVRASPLARRIARERGVELAGLRGSGPGGRIVRADVEAAATAAPAAAPAPAAGAGGAKGETTPVELTRTQATIARRMAESRATVPDFTVTVDVDAEAALDLREQLKAALSPAPSVNDLVVKACALALREHPRVNGSYRDARFELHSRINVGVAVAGEDALVVPTVFDADTKPLADIARESRALAERVRAGTVTPPELSGATFTVSNLGMFGVSRFTAIINPPQAAILAVGAALPRPAVRDGRLVERRVMELTLACDHRILYGADAAIFLGRVRELLERPVALVL